MAIQAAMLGSNAGETANEHHLFSVSMEQTSAGHGWKRSRSTPATVNAVRTGFRTKAPRFLPAGPFLSLERTFTEFGPEPRGWPRY
jgi:hypothetical protein